MDTLFLGQNKITLSTVDSTNNYAAKLLKMSFVPDGTVIMAQNQTNGKGQRTNKWESSPGENLLTSIILNPKNLKAADNYLISMITALAVKDALTKLTGNDRIQIKWPNDIILGDKKTGGILIENTIVKGMVKFSIIGIGLNVNQIDFQSTQATSIRKETNKISDTDFLLEKVCKYLEKWYLKLNLENDSIIHSFNESIWRKNSTQKFIINKEFAEGKISKIATNGNIEVVTENGTFYSDRTEIKIPYE